MPQPVFNHQSRYYRRAAPRKPIFAIATLTLAEPRGLAEKFSAEAKDYDHLGRGGAMSLRPLAQQWRIAEVKPGTCDRCFALPATGA